MVQVAVLGYGVVGSGTAEVIRMNNDSISDKVGDKVVVSKILDIRDFPGSPDADIITHDANEVFENPDIDIVVETIGGATIAYEFTKRALSNGKHVVTSNKELVAKHGPELLKLAKDNNVSYMYEASVGGGIPIIRPLGQCLAANEITGILGILNGTTNYILTKMKKEGKDFAECLKEAQANGYAEQDPTADIEGHDAVRKIAILSSLAYGEYVDSENISTEGITKLTLNDMKFAEKIGSTIKLLALSRRVEDGIYARVSPVVIPLSHPLSSVEDVFNGIMVRGNALGDAMFYGRGAGKLPTASAVVADVIDCAKNLGEFKGQIWEKKSDNNIIDCDKVKSAWMVRCASNGNQQEAIDIVKKQFGDVEIITLFGEEQFAFVTDLEVESEILKKIDECPVAVGKVRMYK